MKMHTYRCAVCGRQVQVADAKTRKDRYPGEYCDGLGFGLRHPLEKMREIK